MKITLEEIKEYVTEGQNDGGRATTKLGIAFQNGYKSAMKLIQTLIEESE